MPGDEGAAGGRRGFLRSPFGGLRRLRTGPTAKAEQSPAAGVIRADAADNWALIDAGLERKFPAGMAELYVYRKEPTAEHRDRFGIRATCHCQPVQELPAVYGRPDLDFNRQVGPLGRLPADFLRAMHTWSDNKGKLNTWLYDHYHPEQARHELVIWDDTGFRIPWELFWLEADPDSGQVSGWLGAIETVTRWLTIDMSWPKRLKPFQDPYQSNGAVAAFIDTPMARDASLLVGFRVEPAADMEILFKKLTTGTGELAVVYVACHGTFSDRPRDCKLGDFTLERAIELIHLGSDLARLRDQPTLVFLNACNSGSLGIDEGTYNDEALRGFAEVFLRAGAAGVLATTGAVGMDAAHEVARDLLNHLRTFPDVPVAEALRRLRVRAWRGTDLALLKTKPTQANRAAADAVLLPLIDHFMYVYYGSPRMVISLARSGLAGTGELAGTGGSP